MRRHLVPKLVGAVVLLASLGGGVASAFTASNTVQGSMAGEGIGVVSGYVVTNVHYTLVQAQNQYDQLVDIGGVSFTLDAPATQVGYGLVNSGNQNVGGGTCTPEAQSSTVPPNSFTCTAELGSAGTNSTPAGYAAVSEVTGLDVFAAS